MANKNSTTKNDDQAGLGVAGQGVAAGVDQLREALINIDGLANRVLSGIHNIARLSEIAIESEEREGVERVVSVLQVISDLSADLQLCINGEIQGAGVYGCGGLLMGAKGGAS